MNKRMARVAAAIAETAGGDDARAREAARFIRTSLVIPVLDIIGDRWALLLLAALTAGPERFDGLARRIGIARSTLTQRLGDLARDGLVERRPYQQNPPRFEYGLTARGRDTLPILHAIRNWDRTWASAESFEAWPMPDEPERRLICRDCGRPIHARDMRYRAAPDLGPRAPRRALALPAGGARSPRRNRRSRESASRPQLLTSAADTLGNRSLALVIAAAFFGLRRFSDMERALALAPNVLARCLDDLVSAGVLARHVYRERPRRWQYILTEKGLDLYPVIVAQIGWADRWLVGPAGPPLQLTHMPCGKTLVPVLAPAKRAPARRPV
ncbi:MAG: helix-turn-helix transcriptional regulator [Rhodospirillaceae bacterium]|nr:helix-turn-helix transcriptional regulator [Rhodospirillaceae bacterium]